MKNYPSEHNSLGTIRYNEEVLRTMVNMALSEVEGISGVDGRGSGNILGRKNYTHVNKINVEENKAVIELSIVVEYGLLLRDVAQQVQQKVRERIESMTDLRVEAVNVTVAGLDLKE